MSKKGWIWLLVIIVIIAAIVLIKKPSKTEVAGDTIKIGFIGPLTGDAASLGTASRAAVELAASELNDKGGINGKKVEVVYEDGKCTAGPAVSAANKLINSDKVAAIVGGLCSSETSAFVNAAMAAKTPTVAYCSSAPTLTGAGKYFFRDYPSDAFQGKFAAEYLYNKLGARKVALMYHISDYGTGIKTVFAKRFTELGGQIVDEEGLPQEARDYKAEITKIKASNPDYVYTAMYPDGGTVFVNQLSQTAKGLKLFGSDGWGDTKFQKEVSGKADILISTAKTAAMDEFNAKMQAKNPGVQVPVCAPQAYDAFNVIAAAIGKAGTNPDKIISELHKIDFQGVSGKITFDEKGDLPTADYVVKRIENGGATEVK